MGRPRKPTHLQILSGGREDRINRYEPTPAPAEIAPPVPLSEGAQAVWDRLAPDLIAKHVLTAWDVDMFAVFCDAVATYQACERLMGREYLVPGSVPNTLVKSPYLRIMRDCSETIVRFGGRFGLTPSDRAGIDVSAPPPRQGAERILT
jgi:P27 family predicted phage terminase small subunit